ncbi:MAG TPA: GNAT family N-acetyltransferase [Xanthomonadaceae bacterium]|nr:GNAT family N-acetyltransferase [Xanthomonadaceae bacterium]
MNYDESTASSNTGPIGGDSIGADQEHSRWIEMLHDRTLVAIRPMTEQDAAAEHAFTEALSSRLRHLRFQGQLVCPFTALTRQFDVIGQDRTLAFAAFIPDGLNESILGIGSYSTTADGSSCTCDVAALDEWHCRGLGSMLMRHLIEIARGKGIDYMFGADSVQNAPMIELAERLGFSQQINPGDRSQILHGLWL